MTIDELRADLADKEEACRAAYKAYHAIRVPGSDPCWQIDKRLAWEDYDAAVVARDAAESALFAAIDAEAVPG